MATDQSTVPHYYLCDHLGSTRAIVPETYHYYPYGLMWQQAEQPIGSNTYLFTGKEWQAQDEIDLYDFGARFYQPRFGKWLSFDPLAEKYMGISPYAYCVNDPVNRVDPDGRRIVDALGNVLFENGSWTEAAKGTDALRVGSAMLKTETGQIVWKKMEDAPYAITITIHEGKGPNKNELGRHDRHVAGADIHIYESSIEEQIEPQYTGDRATYLRTLSKEDRIGTIGVHEGYHAIDKTEGFLAARIFCNISRKTTCKRAAME